MNDTDHHSQKGTANQRKGDCLSLILCQLLSHQGRCPKLQDSFLSSALPLGAGSPPPPSTESGPRPSLLPTPPATSLPGPVPLCYLATPSMTGLPSRAHSSLGFLLAVPILQSSLSGLPHPGTFSFLDLTLNPDLHLHVSRVQGGHKENFPGSWPCLRAFFLLPLSFSSFFFIPAPLVTSYKTWESSSPKRLKCMILCKKSIHGGSGLFPLPGAGDFIE